MVHIIGEEDNTPKQEMTEEQRETLRKTIRNLVETGNAEGVEDGPVNPTRPNLALFDIEPTMRHLYERAEMQEHDGELRFVVQVHEWWTQSKVYNGTGKDKDGVEKNLGRFIEQMENGPEGWRVFNVLPNGAGSGAVVLRRAVSVVLPTPELLAPEEEGVTAMTPEEAAEHEKSVAQFLEKEPDDQVVPLEEVSDVDSTGGVEGADYEA